jgi:hypothetical protein
VDSSFFAPIADKDVPASVSGLVVKWRSYAEDLEYNGPVLWRVKAGFTMVEHAPKFGPCAFCFRDLLCEKYHNNDPTTNALVFFIPRLIATGCTFEEQMSVLLFHRESCGLPENHCASFGTATLISGLVMAHRNLLGENAPLNGLMVRTDTKFRGEGGSRIALGFFWEYGGLTAFPGPCADEDHEGDLGVFPLGIERDR